MNQLLQLVITAHDTIDKTGCVILQAVTVSAIPREIENGDKLTLKSFRCDFLLQMFHAWKREPHGNVDEQYIYFLQIFSQNKTVVK